MCCVWSEYSEYSEYSGYSEYSELADTACRVPTTLSLTNSFPLYSPSLIKLRKSVFRFYILPPIEGRVGEGS